MAATNALNLVSAVLARVTAGEDFAAVAAETGLAQVVADAQQAAAQIPVVVIGVNGGLINDVNANQEVRVIVLDQDTEGGDEDRIADVDGEDCYVSDFHLDGNPCPGDSVDPAYIEDVIKQLVEQGF